MSGDRIELALRGYEQASQPAALEQREQASPARAKILGEQFCGKSAYPPILSVNADMRAQRLSAKSDHWNSVAKFESCHVGVTN